MSGWGCGQVGTCPQLEADFITLKNVSPDLPPFTSAIPFPASRFLRRLPLYASAKSLMGHGGYLGKVAVRRMGREQKERGAEPRQRSRKKTSRQI